MYIFQDERKGLLSGGGGSLLCCVYSGVELHVVVHTHIWPRKKGAIGYCRKGLL